MAKVRKYTVFQRVFFFLREREREDAGVTELENMMMGRQHKRPRGLDVCLLTYQIETS